MRIITLLLLLGSSYSAYADVYKCYTPSKQVTYQPTPCSAGTADQNKVDIETLTPQQIEEAKNRQLAIEAERKALDKNNQARQEAIDAQWQTELLKREVESAKREAEAARLEAAEAKQQATMPYSVITPYPVYNYNYGWDYNQHHHQQHQTPPNNTSPFLPPKVEPFFLPQPMIPPSPPRWGR